MSCEKLMLQHRQLISSEVFLPGTFHCSDKCLLTDCWDQLPLCCCPLQHRLASFVFPKTHFKHLNNLRQADKIQKLLPSTIYFLAGGFVLNLRNYLMFLQERNKIFKGWCRSATCVTLHTHNTFSYITIWLNKLYWRLLICINAVSLILVFEHANLWVFLVFLGWDLLKAHGVVSRLNRKINWYWAN